MTGLFDGFEGYRIVGDDDKNEALKSALVAIDANVLLSLYRYNRRTTDDLLAIFERLGDRLVVPHQALREFHRNRITAIGNPGGAAKDARDAFAKNRRSTNEAMESWARSVALDDDDLQRHQRTITELFDRLVAVVDETETGRVHPGTPAERDPVMSRLVTLLDGKVLPRPDEPRWAELVAEGKRRVVEQRPPGYLDADKDTHPEGGAGDFLVYWQACETAKERGLDLVIVTNDEKEDWWWRHRSEFIGPRHEMTEEFFDLTGRRLHLLRVRDLLARSAALDVEVSPASVEDAERDGRGFDAASSAAEIVRAMSLRDPEVVAIIRAAIAAGGGITADEAAAILDIDPADFERHLARAQSTYGVRPLEPVESADGSVMGYLVPTEFFVALGGVVQGKYAPLTTWLLAQTGDALPMTFAGIEQIIGSPLAPSARKHTPYWYSSVNSLGKAVADAGFKASLVDFETETVTFVRRPVD
ncbi:PIN-like domain-containing protein [Dactylosporangium sp. CS-047395]|uniref:PIN-like domain-containing protein n=1 Tax=Dactylosporangium sp. CS-047395 TaxID=3239936 RepID=UPI003D902EC2